MQKKTGQGATTVPEIFESQKCRILENLSVPDAEYTDFSPKGSVDEGVRDLIRNINARPGLVTTSSCAGRISVFLEGRRPQEKQQEQRQFAPSGGKGAGKWLYVSHEAVKEARSFHELFGMVGIGDIDRINIEKAPAPRLVHFHFEPLVCIYKSLPFSHCFLYTFYPCCIAIVIGKELSY